MNFYNEQTGQSPQAEVGHQHYGTEVLWSVSGTNGVTGFNFFQDDKLVYYPLPYNMRPGDEQVLSRWNMFKQKLTVSRVQCVMQVLADGTAVAESRGKGPTLWRERGGQWYALQKGERAPLAEGDQLSLDFNDPEAAVFTCQDVRALQQGGYSQGGYPQGSDISQSQRCYVQVTADFAAEQEGYLGIRAGDIIEVVQVGEPGGWWQGTMYEQVGWFPSSYCSEPFYQ